LPTGRGEGGVGGGIERFEELQGYLGKKGYEYQERGSQREVMGIAFGWEMEVEPFFGRRGGSDLAQKKKTTTGGEKRKR